MSTQPTADPVVGVKIPTGTLVSRALRRSCPICGERDIWTGWYALKAECPHCNYHFEREHGYYLGAMTLNVIFSELLVMVLMAYLLIGTDYTWWKIELLILPLTVIVPLICYPFFKGIWMAMDLVFHPLKPHDLRPRKQQP